MKVLSKWLWRGLILALLAALLYQGWIYWQVTRLDTLNPEDTALMRGRMAEMTTASEPARIDYRWVPMPRISRYLQRALIASEDATFYSHEGFDWEGIKVAAEKNIKQGKVVAGGSTITQQLAKNLFLSTQRTPWRKGQEAIITVMLEKSLSKQRIFEIYLNVIEWGNGVFGAEAAAHHYFGKSAAKLTPREAAWLAAIVPNPRYYDTHRNARRAMRKTKIILARMAVRYGRDFNAAPRLIAPPAKPMPELDMPKETEPSAEPEIAPTPTAGTETSAPQATPPPDDSSPPPPPGPSALPGL